MCRCAYLVDGPVTAASRLQSAGLPLRGIYLFIVVVFFTFFAVYYSISNFAMKVVVELVNLARLIGGL